MYYRSNMPLHPCASFSALPELYGMMETRTRLPNIRQGGDEVDLVAVLDQVIALLRQRGRVTYSTLKRQFQLDDAALEDVKNELIEGQRLAVDERSNVLVWTGDAQMAPSGASTPVDAPVRAPLSYTPPYLAGKIRTAKSALEGERKQVTVLFADLKGSTELIRDLDHEAV